MKQYLRVGLFPLCVLAAAILLTAFRLNGSSIGMFHILVFGYDVTDPSLVLGEPRSIRADEWMGWTPLTISESQIGFAPGNTLYAAGQNLTTANVPAANWAMIFKPWLWPFFALPFEYAFALSWWLRSASLLLISYILLLKITRKDVVVSALGAIAFLYSPYYQWWYTSPASFVDVTSYALLTFACFAQLVRESNLRAAALESLLLAYFCLCFALVLYPPGQIPVALFLMVLGLAFLVSNRAYLSRQNVRKIAFGLLAAGMIIVLVLLALYVSFATVVTALRHTVYPGQRIIIPSQYVIAPARLVAGFFNVQLLHGTPPPLLGRNQSDAASFFMFSLFLLPVFLLRLVRSLVLHRHADPIASVTIGFYVVCLLWMTVGLPPGLAQLFQYTPPARTWIVMGLMNGLLIYYYMYGPGAPLSPRFKILASIYSVVCFLLLLDLGGLVMSGPAGFAPTQLAVILIAIVGALLLWLLLMKRRREFAILLVLFTLFSSLGVNPLYRGLSPVLGTDLSAELRRINNQDGGHSVWVVYDRNEFANYLAANGLRVLNGLYVYPNLAFWRQFDPTGQYEDVYNRYGYSVFATSLSDQPVFELVQGDLFRVSVAPCSPVLANLDVNYYIFAEEVDASCLRPVDQLDYPNLRLYVYARRQGDSAQVLLAPGHASSRGFP